jgi:hypothetical protein
MAKVKVEVEIEIPDFPETEDDWQLFNMEDAAGVAKNLTQALKECFNISEAGDAWRHMYSAMIDHSKYGATDRETREVAREILHRYHPAFVNAITGKKTIY